MDPETDTSYNYHRDYDPRLGRYIQSDPIGLNGGISTYGYVGQNPLSYVDPLGLFYESGHPYADLPLWKQGILRATESGMWGSGGRGNGIAGDQMAMAAEASPEFQELMNDYPWLGPLAGVPLACRGGKSLDDIGEAGLSDINKSMGGIADGTAMNGKDVSTVFANAAYREGNLNKAASAIRDIAGGHLFKDGNKRTAQTLAESLLPDVSSSQIRKAVDGAGNGTLRSVDDIARTLGGG